MSNRKILVVGAGAIGGIYAAYASKLADVAVLDTNAAHVAAIRDKGLAISGAAELVAKLEAFTSPAEMGRCSFDAVVILVKSQFTAPAFLGLKPYLEGRPLLVTFQNGMGNVEALEPLCDFDIAHGVSFEAGRYIGPGRIDHFIHGQDSWMGPARGPAGSMQWLGELWTGAGLPTRVAADPRGAIWGKFIFNCVMNPCGAIVLGENRARYDVPQMREVIYAMFAEGIAVADAQGIKLPYDPMHLVKKLRAGEILFTRHAGSMAVDVANGRETELEAMTGYLVRKAKSLGVPVPVSETVYKIAKGVEYAAQLKKKAP